MKKILKYLAIVLAVLFLALAVTPFLFKGKLKTLVQEEANNMLKAEFYFGEVDLSFFRNFPNATVSITDYGIVGKNLFEGDTLIQGLSFDLTVNPFGLIMSDAIPLKSISLNQPKVQALILHDGTANWDIMKPDSTTSEATENTDGSGFLIKLQSYELKNASLIYKDATLPMRVEIDGLDHRGKGDFSATTYNLRTQSQAKSLKVVYDGIAYLNKAALDAQMDMRVEMEPDIKVTFMDNTAKINALPISLDGFLALVGDDIEMDLSFETKSATFQSLLSMVPGVYTADFKDIETEGSLAFSGYLKGTYNDTQMPAFGLELKAEDAWFKYPDLPTKVSGIEVDMSIENPDGDLEKTKVDIRSFRADFGNNPIEAKASIQGITRMKLDGQLKASINLAELTSMIPIKETTLKGTFKLDATASGIYDEAAQSFPKVKVDMQLADAYTKNAAYPVELSKMSFIGKLTNTDGSMQNTRLDVSRFYFKLDEEPINGSLRVSSFDDPNYYLRVSGKLDLEKLMKLYPIEGLEVKGTVIVDDFSTQGKMSEVEAARYTNLPTTGKIRVQNLYYSDAAYPEAVTVDNAFVSFTPDKMRVSQASGKLGSSDYQVDGYFSNYLAFALMDNQALTGEMNLSSNKMDLNEWMLAETNSDSEEATGAEVVDTDLSVIAVPDQVAITFDAKIGELIYDNLSLKNMKGQLVVADQEISMQNLSFNMLGATVSMNGAYNTRNIRKPGYEFFMDITNLGIKDAWATFNTVQAFAPVAEFVEGLFNTTFGIKGSLKANMMPYLSDITGLGLFEILEGGINNNPLLQAISEQTNINQFSNLKLKDIAGSFEIEDGYLGLKPFTVNHNEMSMTLSGRQHITGQMDYEVELELPSGAIGEAATSALAGLTAGAVKASDRVKLDFKLGGSFKKPLISALGGNLKDQMKDQAADILTDKLRDELGTDVSGLPLDSAAVQAQVDSLKEEITDSIKTVVEESKQQALDSLKQVTEALKDSLKEEVKDQIGKDVANQLDSLKKLLGLPKFGKKKKKN